MGSPFVGTAIEVSLWPETGTRTMTRLRTFTPRCRVPGDQQDVSLVLRPMATSSDTENYGWDCRANVGGYRPASTLFSDNLRLRREEGVSAI